MTVCLWYVKIKMIQNAFRILLLIVASTREKTRDGASGVVISTTFDDRLPQFRLFVVRDDDAPPRPHHQTRSVGWCDGQPTQVPKANMSMSK